jgi:hypothetical protein
MVEWLKDVKERFKDVIDLVLFLGNAITFGKFSDNFAEWAAKAHDAVNKFSAENNVDINGSSIDKPSGQLGPVVNNMPTINFNIDGAKSPQAVGDEIQRIMPDAYWNRTPGELGTSK